MPAIWMEIVMGIAGDVPKPLNWNILSAALKAPPPITLVRPLGCLTVLRIVSSGVVDTHWVDSQGVFANVLPPYVDAAIVRNRRKANTS